MICAVVLAGLLVLQPRLARAQCELPGQPEAAAALATTVQSAAVSGMTAAVIAAVESTTTLARAAIVAGMDVGWLMLRDRLNQYWLDQQEALKGAAAQLNASQLDQTRQLGAMTDVQDMNAAAKRIQRMEYKTKREFITTDQGCRFDTTGIYMGPAMSVTRSIAAGGTRDIGDILSNKAGTDSARGRAADTAARVGRARGLFCARYNNGGYPGCAGDAGEFADAHVLPSRTIFGRPTVDLSDPRTVPALKDVARNIVGYEAPNPMLKDDLKRAAGMEKRMNMRETAAQMDVAGGLVWGVISERFPSREAPEIAAMRSHLGAVPDPKPSEYEIRRQVVEQLWTPAYYVGLQDVSNATRQKQLYLRAYSVLQLYKLIEKMEKISSVYAIQTSNLVEKYAPGLDAPAAPTRK